ncbi:MAG: DMT family transporter [Burkholderiaceae bacterium]|nr:DMT family transporter [Burkholderiaceae bacterium]
MQSLWMLVATFLFSIMGVGVKLASDTYSTAEIVAYRGLIGMLVMFAVMRWQGASFRTSIPLQHLWRGAVGVAALWIWFYAIARLPLAMAVTLNYMSPIWLATFLLFGAWLRKTGKTRKIQPGLLFTILGGFIGVVLLLRPSLRQDQLPDGLIALGSGMLAALAYMQVRQMGLAGEPENRVVFYFSISCALAGVVGSTVSGLAGITKIAGITGITGITGIAGGWHAHDLRGALLLLLIGCTAAGAQVALTRAYRLGNPLVTANLQYVGIVYSSIWDLLIWHDALNWLSWLGILVILGSGILASYYNSKNNQSKPAAVTATSATAASAGNAGKSI